MEIAATGDGQGWTVARSSTDVIPLVNLKPGVEFRVTPNPGIYPRISESAPRPILLAYY